jgi:hypothetical protein
MNMVYPIGRERIQVFSDKSFTEDAHMAAGFLPIGV